MTRSSQGEGSKADIIKREVKRRIYRKDRGRGLTGRHRIVEGYYIAPEGR